MTSAINTNGINANYPVPGENNSSQGFRDNFSSIKNNLNTAGTEISDLQSKVVVKSALTGTTINNDMANTVISNVLTRGFRASSYNLGNSVSGTVIVNVSAADVYYGSVSANTTIQFGGWAPAGTQSNVELNLNFSNTSAVVTLPSAVGSNNTYGGATLENSTVSGGALQLTVPANTTALNYRFSTLDCGANISVEPVNRPRKTTMVQTRTPTAIGAQGDRAGATCADATYLYVCTGTYDGATSIWKRITLNSF